MSTENMFELATRQKLRFPFKGQATVEDLWDLSVENLDSVYKTLNAQLKASQEDSLLQQKSAKDTTVALQVDIIKHIVAVKQDEAAKAALARENREKKQKILQIMEQKQDAALQNMTPDQLQELLKGLD